jgi:hypothetical protein
LFVVVVVVQQQQQQQLQHHTVMMVKTRLLNNNDDDDDNGRAGVILCFPLGRSLARRSSKVACLLRQNENKMHIHPFVTGPKSSVISLSF